jgi:hypothetical protein
MGILIVLIRHHWYNFFSEKITNKNKKMLHIPQQQYSSKTIPNFDQFPFFKTVITTKLVEAAGDLETIHGFLGNQKRLNVAICYQILKCYDDQKEFVKRVHQMCLNWLLTYSKPDSDDLPEGLSDDQAEVKKLMLFVNRLESVTESIHIFCDRLNIRLLPFIDEKNIVNRRRQN